VVTRAFAGARPTEENKFKITLTERTLAGVIADARS
jgi:xanthine dehydrogenase YagS FAD-binding subunit